MLSIAALLVLGMPQGTTPPAKPAPDAVVATVDGAPITAAEIEPYLWAWKSREVATEIASHQMVAAEALRKGVTISDAEVKAKMDEQIAALKTRAPQDEPFEKFLAEKLGGTSHIALLARTTVLVDKLALLDFAPEKYVKVSSIAFRTNGDTTDVLSKAIKGADAAYAALQAGKPWAEVLRTHEKDPRILATGGLVGWKALAAFPESIRTQLATTKPLGVTKPTQTSFGIQIFRLDARGSAANPADLADLKGQYLLSARESVVPKLRERTKIEIR